MHRFLRPRTWTAATSSSGPWTACSNSAPGSSAAPSAAAPTLDEGPLHHLRRRRGGRQVDANRALEEALGGPGCFGRRDARARRLETGGSHQGGGSVRGGEGAWTLGRGLALLGRTRVPPRADDPARTAARSFRPVRPFRGFDTRLSGAERRRG